MTLTTLTSSLLKERITLICWNADKCWTSRVDLFVLLGRFRVATTTTPILMGFSFFFSLPIAIVIDWWDPKKEAKQLTLAMRSGKPVSIPPCIRKPQGRPPSRMTRRTTFPLTLLLLLLPLTTATSSVPRAVVTTSVPAALMIKDKKKEF